MGTWGTGAFENDDALDWIGELEARRGDSRVRAALERAASAKPGKYLDAWKGQVALGAAEVVAAAQGRPAKDLPDEVLAWLEANREAVRRLAESAVHAIDRVMAAEGSELRELWSVEEGADAEDVAEWESQVADLRRRLVSG